MNHDDTAEENSDIPAMVDSVVFAEANELSFIGNKQSHRTQM